MPVINNSDNNIIALYLFFVFKKNYNKLNNQVL